MSESGALIRFGSPRRHGRHWGRLAILCAVLLAVAGCGKPERAAPVRPVRAVTISPHEVSQTFSQVGEIQPRTEIDVGFRLGGKIVQRPVDVGAVLKKGDLLARLDDQPQRNRLQTAEATLAGAEAEATRTEAEAARQNSLLSGGYTTKQRYEMAKRDFQTAQAQIESARAQLNLAKDNLAYSELHADTAGVITAVYADAGQVVTAGQRVVRMADPRERDAVFWVPASAIHLLSPDTPVDVVLTRDGQIHTIGKVRYVSPQADPITRTYTVRVSLEDAPDDMRLGATITGSVKVSGQKIVEIPGAALFEDNGKPAVWLFDPATGTVNLKPVAVQRYESAAVLLSSGLKDGDVVVTAGVHVLRPGQKVRLLAEAGR